MAKKKQAPAPDSVLVTAARRIGAAAGKMAIAVGVAAAPPEPKVTKPPKKSKKATPPAPKARKATANPLVKKTARKVAKKQS